MDEYFCPKCGAILNDQYGFDPNGGTWRCTECGELLMDDDVYNGDSFEGVAWYCDNCGALLNRQSGFSDSYGSWTCTECGHRNGTTESDIISEDPEFECPNCGVALDFQPGFNRYDDDWECTACGSHLHHSYSSDQYSVVEEPKHKCPNCGAGLDDQWCFADYQNNWKCTECGAHLHHSYSDDEYTVMKHICPNCDAPLDIQWGFNEYDDDWECTECGAHLHHDYSDDEDEEVDSDSSSDDDDDEDESDDSSDSYSSGCSYSSSSSAPYNSSNNKSNGYSSGQNYSSSHTSSANTYSSKPKKKANWKLRIIGTLFLIVAVIIAAGYYEIKLLIPVGHASTDLVGRDYEYVVDTLKEAGFSSVTSTEIADLPLSKISEENKVDAIKIGFADEFSVTSKYPSNFPVVITYHTLEKYAVPMSSKEAKGANYKDVVDRFKDAGFENITLEVEYDIITGWMTDDGEVKSVVINDDKKFSSGKEYRADAEIVITYHTYRSNKPK